MTDITFDSLPNAVTQIFTKLENIERLLDKLSDDPQQESDHWLDLNDLVQYDPEKRSKQTFYGYVHKRTIPFHKSEKKIIFLKSEIDDWLKQGRRKTRAEIEAEAGQNLKIRRAVK